MVTPEPHTRDIEMNPVDAGNEFVEERRRQTRRTLPDALVVHVVRFEPSHLLRVEFPQGQTPHPVARDHPRLPHLESNIYDTR